jgi:positive regulator of sigma E activity
MVSYAKGMKPTIPETGTVIKVEKSMVVVVLNSVGSCKGCGAAKMGLCKPAGNMSVLKSKNTLNAVVGDTVKIGLDIRVQRKGFFLAYIIPVISFITGSLAGDMVGRAFSIPSLEVITGFSSLLLSSLYAFRMLKKLDASSLMTVKEIVSGDHFCGEGT